MVGYGEIRCDDDASFYGWLNQGSRRPSSLQGVFREIEDPHFLSVTIANKEAVYEVLRDFLQPREESHVRNASGRHRSSGTGARCPQ
jgi:hypothetical protein